MGRVAYIGKLKLQRLQITDDLKMFLQINIIRLRLPVAQYCNLTEERELDSAVTELVNTSIGLIECLTWHRTTYTEILGILRVLQKCASSSSLSSSSFL